jgi:DNA invertase Pin-like site-specific DNA recombinase
MGTYAGIVRVSHMGDRKAGAHNVHTDREQVEAIRSATPRGAELEVLPHELDVSGGLPLDQRPSLFEAVEGVESGRFAGIILAYQSRLFRNVEEEEAVWRRVEAAGGEVLFGLEQVDNKTVDGRMLRRIKSVQNTAERERHAENFERLRETSTKRGIWQRRQTPRGYRKDPHTRKLVPDARADEVRETFRAYLAGTTISELARRLRMTKSGVRQLLRNRVYLGELQVGKHVNPGAYDELIDIETFEGVQANLNSAVRPGRNGGAPALLAGLARCSSCGHLMTRTGSSGGPVYACPKRHSGKDCPDPAAVMMGRLDRYVIPIALRELARLRVSASEGNEVERDRAEMAATERELKAYLSAISAADVGAEAFAAGARERREKVEAVAERMRVKRARQRAVPQVGTGAEVWEDLNAHDRNALLRALLTAVVVRPTGGQVVPIAQRVRVIAFGVEFALPRHGGGEAAGIVPIPFHDLDGVGVLGVPTSEDGS